MATIFCAVRLCNEGTFEYIDIDTIATSRERVEKLVARDAKTLPDWHEERPVIRIPEFDLVEKEAAK